MNDWQETVGLIYDKMRLMVPGIAAAAALQMIEERHPDFFVDGHATYYRAEAGSIRRVPYDLARLERLLLSVAEALVSVARHTEAANAAIRVRESLATYMRSNPTDAR